MVPAWSLQLVVPALLLIGCCLGKLPPTVPPCPASQVELVSRCQEKAKQKVTAHLPRRRHQLFEMFTDRILGICQQVESYVKCTGFIAEEECEMNESSYAEDHEVLSVLPLCRHKYVYEKHSTLHLCLMQHRQIVAQCRRAFHVALRPLRGLGSNGGPGLSEERCRIIDGFQDCVSNSVARQCQLPSSHTELVVLLAKAAVPHSFNCTRLRTAKYQSRESPVNDEGGSSGAQFCSSGFTLTAALFLLTVLLTW